MDPTLSIAVSIQQNPGVYALLLGSGISLSAGVPTGWGIIVELVQRIGRLQGDEVAPEDVESWYREHFGREVEYGTLLDDLAKSQAERAQLLRGYFEPTLDEREEGLKRPTPAHHAIAELVDKGYIRVILTTNFDRLLEQALEQRGVVPTVIATPDAVKGARPLAHSPCTIIKVHGDYIDARIRNTPEELGSYDPELDRLLDQVIDEYGMIVCGWSATWDPALRAAFERAKGHRFSTYWTTVGEPSELAKEVISARRAHIIRVQGADEFFRDVAEKVISLEELSRPHPLIGAVAVQTLKRYLPDPLHRIRLRELVMQEATQVAEAISDPELVNGQWGADELLRRVRFYEQTASTMMDLLATGCYYAQGKHDALWSAALTRVARAAPAIGSGITHYLSLRSYPALLAMYAGGIAAVAAGEYETLAAVLTQGERADSHGRAWPLFLTLRTHDVMRPEVAQMLPGMERNYVPVSLRLEEMLKPHLLPLVGDEQEYGAAFERFEYLVCLIYQDEYTHRGYYWSGPVGAWAYRARHRGGGPAEEVARETEAQGKEWPLLRAGLFGGDLGRLKETKQETDEHVRSVLASSH